MIKSVKIALFLLLGIVLTSISIAGGEETKIIFKASTNPGGIQKVDMVGGSYFFKPNYVIVKINVPVELAIKKEPGVVPHNIVMSSQEAGMSFKKDLTTDPKTIKFTPTKIGKYPFYCDKGIFFWNHREKGMEGVVEVTD